ncbi:hypothetical protein [Shewanella sp.]|uniref:hypothetical protein n=1 Tax=Shewanella sp. TaxID=50422 RepID=UPI00356AE6F9
MKTILSLILLLISSLVFSSEMIVQTKDGKKHRFDTSKISKVYFLENEKTFSVKEYVINTKFLWIDKTVGKELGIITFSSDGSAYPSWSRVKNTWEIDENNDLIIYTDGYLYVNRFKLNKSNNYFNGARDKSSNRKDGVISLLKPVK